MLSMTWRQAYKLNSPASVAKVGIIFGPATSCWCAMQACLRVCAHAGHLLRLRDRDGKPLTRARLIEEFAVFFIAGSETTGHTVAWTL